MLSKQFGCITGIQGEMYSYGCVKAAHMNLQCVYVPFMCKTMALNFIMKMYHSILNSFIMFIIVSFINMYLFNELLIHKNRKKSQSVASLHIFQAVYRVNPLHVIHCSNRTKTALNASEGCRLTANSKGKVQSTSQLHLVFGFQCLPISLYPFQSIVNYIP